MAWGEDKDPFYGAPVVLIVLADRSVSTYLYDGNLVMGNLMNAAHAEGLGSCRIHRAKEEFECPDGKTLLNSLGIEGGTIKASDIAYSATLRSPCHSRRKKTQFRI